MITFRITYETTGDEIQVGTIQATDAGEAIIAFHDATPDFRRVLIIETI